VKKVYQVDIYSDDTITTATINNTDFYDGNVWIKGLVLSVKGVRYDRNTEGYRIVREKLSFRRNVYYPIINSW